MIERNFVISVQAENFGSNLFFAIVGEFSILISFDRRNNVREKSASSISHTRDK